MQNKLADVIKAERERLGWTPAELARHADTSRQNVSEVEAGKRLEPNDAFMRSIAQAFASSARAELTYSQWMKKLYIARGVEIDERPLPVSQQALDLDLILEQSSDKEQMLRILRDLGDELLPTLQAIRASYETMRSARPDVPTSKKARRSTKQDQHC